MIQTGQILHVKIHIGPQFMSQVPVVNLDHDTMIGAAEFHFFFSALLTLRFPAPSKFVKRPPAPVEKHVNLPSTT